MSMVIENYSLLRRQFRADAVRRREARLAEEITGWAVNVVRSYSQCAESVRKIALATDSKDSRFDLRNAFRGKSFGDLALRTDLGIVSGQATRQKAS